MSDKDKIRKYLQKMMKGIPSDKQMKKLKLKTPFAFCYAQARFDMLMNLDLDLKLGAFYQ